MDLRFMDFPAVAALCRLQTPSLKTPSRTVGFDGSSIRGWQAINESDMLVMPQADTAIIDPFMKHTTLAMICNIQDPLTKEDYTRDPRNVARKAVNYMKSTGIADVAYFGPESEFFVFDDVRFDQKQYEGFYHIDSAEGEWNRGREEMPNLGYKIRYKKATSLARLLTRWRLLSRWCSSCRDRHPCRGPAPRSGDTLTGGWKSTEVQQIVSGWLTNSCSTNTSSKTLPTRARPRRSCQAALQDNGAARSHLVVEERRQPVRRQRLGMSDWPCTRSAAS